MEFDKISFSSLNFNDINNQAFEEEKNKFTNLIENYENLVVINISILKGIIESEKTKSVVIYNFGLVVELFLKMLLLRCFVVKPLEISSFSHSISGMFNAIYGSEFVEKCIKKQCEEVQNRLSLIKTENGNKVNFDRYYDYRYNHEKNSMNLLSIGDVSDNDIKYIIEVIECIELVMKK